MSAKISLLQIVQKILSDMDRDEINSLSDTLESVQIASIVEDVFNQMILNNVIPEREDVIQVEAVSDTTRPNYLKLPQSVDRMKALRYNKIRAGETRVQYDDIDFMTPSEFLDRVLARNTDLTEVIQVVDSSGVILPILNNAPPSFWTSFDDEFIVTDSYDSDVDLTLQSSKTLAIGTRVPTFEAGNDDYIPDIDEHLFPLLIAEAKSTAFVVLKQQANAKIEQQSRKQKVSIQSNKHRMRDFTNDTPNFGRK